MLAMVVIFDCSTGLGDSDGDGISDDEGVSGWYTILEDSFESMVSSGEHTFTWTYAKDGSADAGDDCRIGVGDCDGARAAIDDADHDARSRLHALVVVRPVERHVLRLSQQVILGRDGCHGLEVLVPDLAVRQLLLFEVHFADRPCACIQQPSQQHVSATLLHNFFQGQRAQRRSRVRS